MGAGKSLRGVPAVVRVHEDMLSPLLFEAGVACNILTLSTLVGYGTRDSPTPLLHMRLAINDTDPITMIPTSTVSPPYGSTICACEVLAVLVVGEGEVVPVPVPVEVAELEVAAAVAGREESFASACYHDILISVLLFILVSGPVTITKEWTPSQHVPRSEI